MIHRKFDKLKFRRTYIGGSKQRELEIFASVQGNKEDNSECDWFEYRKLLVEFCDDTLNIVFSWKYIFNILRYVFVFLTIYFSFVNPMWSISIVLIGFISHIIFHYLKNKEINMVKQYSHALDIINIETGINLPKN